MKKPLSRFLITWIILMPAMITVVSGALGLTIEHFAPDKTMRMQLLWAFIPTVSLMVYASFLGAVLLHKITDRLSRLNKRFFNNRVPTPLS
jgi:hypothetical protein